MRVYISGRIKDYAGHLAHFRQGCDSMRNAGHDPVNPCDLLHAPDATYADFLREDLKALLDCDAIFMLEGWEQSVGAHLEHNVACLAGLRLWYENAPFTELTP
jgi:hypothetical protein